MPSPSSSKHPSLPPTAGIWTQPVSRPSPVHRWPLPSCHDFLEVTSRWLFCSINSPASPRPPPARHLWLLGLLSLLLPPMWPPNIQGPRPAPALPTPPPPNLCPCSSLPHPSLPDPSSRRPQLVASPEALQHSHPTPGSTGLASSLFSYPLPVDSPLSSPSSRSPTNPRAQFQGP